MQTGDNKDLMGAGKKHFDESIIAPRSRHLTTKGNSPKDSEMIKKAGLMVRRLLK